MASEMKKTKSREPNLLSSEREVLLSVLEEHKHITDCKKTDSVTSERKRKEWLIISEEFNLRSALHYRDALFLKQSWENIKKRAKKDAAENKLQLFKTGGGPLKKLKENGENERVLGMLEATTSGFNNHYDGDSSFLTSPLRSNAEILCPSATDDNFMLFNTNVCENIDENELSNDWSQYTPDMLRQPITPALKLPKTSLQASNYKKSSEECVPFEEEALITTPQSIKPISDLTQGISRRRPSLTRKVADSTVQEARKRSLEVSAELARKEQEQIMRQREEEHQLKMEILKEQLAQEKIKTRLLDFKMAEKSNTEWLDSN